MNPKTVGHVLKIIGTILGIGSALYDLAKEQIDVSRELTDEERAAMHFDLVEEFEEFIAGTQDDDDVRDPPYGGT